MALAGLLNDKDEGVVTSNSFNLTRVTAALALLIGGGTAASGAAAATQEEGTDAIWETFTQSQRLVIIVAVIAAWAVVTASDILGRSFASARAESNGLAILTPVAAQKITEAVNGRDRKEPGTVVAVRVGPPVAFLWQPAAEKPAEWVSDTFIDWS